MTKNHDLGSDLQRAEMMEEGEPLPIFQSLPGIDLATDELADMKRSVHELIHARAVEAALEDGAADSADSEDSSSADGRDEGLPNWARRIPQPLRTAASSAGLRIAAAFGAVALATSLMVPSFAPEPLLVAQAPPAASVPTSAELAEIESLPLVESLSSDAELIQIEDAGMSVVVAAIQ